MKTHLSTAVHRFKIIFTENAKCQLFWEVSLVVLLEASTHWSPQEAGVRLESMFVHDVLKDAVSHGRTTRVMPRNKQNFQFFLLVVLFALFSIETSFSEHSVSRCVFSYRWINTVDWRLVEWSFILKIIKHFTLFLVEREWKSIGCSWFPSLLSPLVTDCYSSIHFTLWHLFHEQQLWGNR